MIHAKAPMRISFCGGGTDHSKWYERHGGCVLSAAIKKYAHCTIDKPWMEIFVVNGRGVYDYTQTRYWTDLPPGSGLGGSSAVAVACIAAEDKRHGIERSKVGVVMAAEALERGHLKLAGGSQDYYPAVYGGCNYLTWSRNGHSVQPVNAYALAEWLLLVCTGETGDRTLAVQKDADIVENSDVQVAMMKMMKLTRDMHEALAGKKYVQFGEMLGEAWKLKKDTSPCCTTERIDHLINRAAKHGAMGAKLCGTSFSHLLICAAPDSLPGIRKVLKDEDCFCEAVEFDQKGLEVWGGNYAK